MAETHAIFRLGRQLAAELDARRGDRSPGVQAKADLLRFYQVLDLELEQAGFSDEELDTLADAYRGDGLDNLADRIHLWVYVLDALGLHHPWLERLRESAARPDSFAAAESIIAQRAIFGELADSKALQHAVGQRLADLRAAGTRQTLTLLSD